MASLFTFRVFFSRNLHIFVLMPDLGYEPLLLLFTLLSRTITIVQYIFITESFKPQLFSSHKKCLHIKLIEYFLNCHCLFFIAFYIAYLCLREISINLDKLLEVLLSPVYIFHSFFFIQYFVVVCLLLNPLFYTDIVAKSLFIRCSCKEAYFIF